MSQQLDPTTRATDSRPVYEPPAVLDIGTVGDVTKGLPSPGSDATVTGSIP